MESECWDLVTLGSVRGALAVADGHAEGHRSAARPRPGVRDPEAAAGGAPGELRPRVDAGALGPEFLMGFLLKKFFLER